MSARRGWLQRWLDAGLDTETADPTLVRRVRTINVGMLCLILFSIPFGVGYWSLGLHSMVLAVAFAAGISVLNLVALRVMRRPELCGHVTAALLYSFIIFDSSHTGGFYDPSFGWFYTLPLAVAMMLGLRAAWLWTGVVGVTAVGFWAAPDLGFEMMNVVPVEFHAAQSLVNRLAAIVAFGAMSTIFLSIQRATERELRQAASAARRESAFVQLLQEATAAAHEAPTVDDALATSAEHVARTLGWPAALVWRADKGDGDSVKLVADRFLSIGGDDRFTELQVRSTACELDGEEGLPGRALLEKRAVWVADPARALPDSRFEHGDLDVRTALALPVIHDDRAVAVLELVSDRRLSVPPRLLDVLGHVGSQIGRVADRKRAERRIRDLAYYDSLTGLPNRQSFHLSLDRALESAQRRGRLMALLFLDLDRFKHVNDTLGHSTGDELLCSVADRFGTSVRFSDFLARSEGGGAGEAISRLGGDEFTVLLSEISDGLDAAMVARRLLECLNEPFELADSQVHTGGSIGIALYPFDGEDSETLLRNADAAMYEAKRRGRNNYQFYTASMNAAASQRLDLENRLHRALERQEFALHYQPVSDSTSGRVIGAEALLRWRNSQTGDIPPDKFIPIAEEAGLIIEIGDWVFAEACRQAATWAAAGHPRIRLSVNLSGHQLRDAGLTARVRREIEKHGLEPCQLELEITESIAMQDDGPTIGNLKALNELGVGLALDDFGTGYSSLSNLRRFPFDRLKIDRSFVSGIGDNKDDEVLTAAIIAMAKKLRLAVVAEGVESRAQADFLRDHGCDELQGHLVGAALPASEMERLLPRD